MCGSYTWWKCSTRPTARTDLKRSQTQSLSFAVALGKAYRSGRMRATVGRPDRSRGATHRVNRPMSIWTSSRRWVRATTSQRDQPLPATWWLAVHRSESQGMQVPDCGRGKETRPNGKVSLPVLHPVRARSLPARASAQRASTASQLSSRVRPSEKSRFLKPGARAQLSILSVKTTSL